MATTTKKSVAFENKFLRVDFDVAGVSLAVTEKATGTRWQMAQATDQDVVIEDYHAQRAGRSLASAEIKQLLPSRSSLPGAGLALRDLGLAIHLWLEGRDLLVDIERLNAGGPARVRDLLFPRHFVLPRKSENYTTWTVGQGSIVPATTRGIFHHPEGYSEQEMAWHGAMNGRSGMIAVAETPFDLYIAMWHLAGQAPGAFIHWLPSLGDLRYTRRVRYHFEKDFGYVRQAKHYRRWLQEQGYWISLAEKAKQNPNVARLKGAAVITSLAVQRRMRNLNYELNTFSDQANWALKLRHRTGLKNAVIHVDGWGRFGYDSVHPETLPPNVEAGGAKALRAFRERMREAGWLFALHDQYIDIFHDAPSYSPDRLMLKEDGRPNTLNVWAGGLSSQMCFSESLKFLRRNFIDGVRDQYMYHNSPPIKQLVDPDAYYLDCFCRIQECHNPLHPLTRTQVVGYMNEIFRTVRNSKGGVVLSCEHPKFYALSDLDFGWHVGHLKADVQVVGGGSETGMIGIPVPLWHLVTHDSLCATAFPSLDLNQLLYAEAPCLANTKDGPTDSELEMKLRVCRLHEVVGFDEMTSFETDAQGVTAQTEFASGVTVQINRSKKTYRIAGDRRVTMEGVVS